MLMNFLSSSQISSSGLMRTILIELSLSRQIPLDCLFLLGTKPILSRVRPHGSLSLEATLRSMRTTRVVSRGMDRQAHTHYT